MLLNNIAYLQISENSMKLMETGIGLVKKHFSLFVIGMGSLSMLGANIFLEKVLSATEYGEYSIFVTYISTIYIFGYLGLEQVILRLSSREENKVINLNSSLLIALILVGISFCSLSSYIYIAYLSDNSFGGIKIFVISLSIVFTMLVFNFYWVISRFSKAQIITNLWKFALVIMAIICYLLLIKNLLELLDWFFYFAIAQIVALIFVCFRMPFKMDLKTNFRSISEFWFHFFIATALLTLILFFDRYFIKEKFGLVVFGQYFYLVSIFLLPFGLLQSYIGFKNLIVFKTNFSWNLFTSESIKHIIFAVIAGIFLLGITYFLTVLNILNIDFLEHFFLIILFLFLGIIRVLFGIAAAAVGAQVSVIQFRKINLYSILLMTSIILVAFYLVVTIEHVIIVMILLWLSRTILYLLSIRTQFKTLE